MEWLLNLPLPEEHLETLLCVLQCLRRGDQRQDEEEDSAAKRPTARVG